jgi:hypothetical protein
MPRVGFESTIPAFERFMTVMTRWRSHIDWRNSLSEAANMYKEKKIRLVIVGYDEKMEGCNLKTGSAYEDTDLRKCITYIWSFIRLTASGHTHSRVQFDGLNRYRRI